jgi:hypothetical protein
MLEESVKHANTARSALASARYWLDRSKERGISRFQRKARIYAARRNLERSETHAEISALALIAHNLESEP